MKATEEEDRDPWVSGTVRIGGSGSVQKRTDSDQLHLSYVSLRITRFLFVMGVSARQRFIGKWDTLPMQDISFCHRQCIGQGFILNRDGLKFTECTIGPWMSKTTMGASDVKGIVKEPCHGVGRCQRCHNFHRVTRVRLCLKFHESELPRSGCKQGPQSQRDVVHLGWPIVPLYMSPNAGGKGLLGLSQWVQLCT